MKIKAFAVVDTNVLVSSLMTDSFPKEIMKLIQNENVIPVFDKRMLNEYHEVLSRKKFGFSSDSIYGVLYSTVSNGIFINDVEQAKIELKDKDDIVFFEVKESSAELSSYLVTGNIKHFPESNSTVTPKEFLNILEMLERYVKTDFDYDKSIEEIKATQLSTPKYTSGQELVNEIFDTEGKKVNESYFEMDL